MYQTCIFDLYGTLVDIHTDEDSDKLWEKMALFYGFYGACYEAGEMKTAYKTIVQKMEKGKAGIRRDSHESFPEIQIEDVFQALFEDRGVEADRTLAVHAGQFFRVLSMEYIRLYEGTEEMLKALRSSGKKLYLLSNAQRIFTEYEMRALDIFKYFDAIYISSDYEFKKPDARFFEKLLRDQNVDVSSAIMIGNDGICDVRGAGEAGLHTLYIHSNISPQEPMPEADYVLDKMDMEQVKNILLSEK
ncbi:MAG: HAD family hydrolase [Coprococcus sp.]